MSEIEKCMCFVICNIWLRRIIFCAEIIDLNSILTTYILFWLFVITSDCHNGIMNKKPQRQHSTKTRKRWFIHWHKVWRWDIIQIDVDTPDAGPINHNWDNEEHRNRSWNIIKMLIMIFEMYLEWYTNIVMRKVDNLWWLTDDIKFGEKDYWTHRNHRKKEEQEKWHCLLVPELLKHWRQIISRI